MSTQKSPPLSKEEVKILLNLIQENKVITSKATNTTNNLLKEDAWSQLTNNFNAQISSCPRSITQLRLKWENLKKAARKRSAKIKMSNTKTGGGKPDYIPPDEILDTVSAILGPLCDGYSVPLGGDSEIEPVPIFVITENIADTIDGNSGNADKKGTSIIFDNGDKENVKVLDPKLTMAKNSPSLGESTPKTNKFSFTSSKSVVAKQKRKLMEEDVKARTNRNKAIAEYYICKKKREESEQEIKEIEKKKMEIQLENLLLENKKLKLELEKLNK